MNDNPYAEPADLHRATVPQSGIGSTLLKVFLGGCIILLLLFLLLPLRRNGREAAHRVQCKNNLKQIALAVRNYEDANGALPPAYTVDVNGGPLHSWRTLILPFLSEAELYESIDLTKPWDDPANALAHETSLNIFRCPSSDIPSNYTTYMGLVGPGACFNFDKPRPLSDFLHLSKTLMVIEVSPKEAVHWMAPQDQGAQFVLTFGPESDLAHVGGTQAAFTDVHVRLLSDRISDEERHAMVSIAGNHDVSTAREDAGSQE
ncbi:MAG: DUF1559 domain-containing protein [Fuerstiella sp.]|nr:DUF1559 domain-containing protein [Fuerstiella sp.]MCP4854715.1 DUF1559 domain-containing protein [Fuerstiella sp.]